MALIELDQQHKGARVEAKVGDTLQVVLPENATTGFRWEVDQPGDALAMERSELVPPTDPAAGSAGTRHVVVRAVRPGSVRLSLRLRRSWEPPEKTEDTYAVDVEVT